MRQLYIYKLSYHATSSNSNLRNQISNFLNLNKFNFQNKPVSRLRAHYRHVLGHSKFARHVTVRANCLLCNVRKRGTPGYLGFFIIINYKRATHNVVRKRGGSNIAADLGTMKTCAREVAKRRIRELKNFEL